MQHTLFGEELCKVASLRETYGDMADCCEKQEPERNECFLKSGEFHALAGYGPWGHKKSDTT